MPLNHCKSCLGAILFVLLSACGGGGGGVPGSPVASGGGLAPMLDSFGQIALDASGTDFGGGSSSAAGVDGTASDGAPISNAVIRVIDNAGRSVSGLTDTQGYYRVRIDGFTPPLIASVARRNGAFWYAPSVSIVKVRGFVTINLTGLTDKLAFDVAKGAGQTTSAQLSPKLLSSNPGALADAKVALNTLLASQILDAGLDPATFDPVTTPFKFDKTGYDKLLSGLTITKPAPLGATVISSRWSVGGSVSGIDGVSGLVLRSGSEFLNVAASASTFTFPTWLPTGTNYAVSVNAQPPGYQCTLFNGTGTIGQSPVTNLDVLCVIKPYAVTTLAGSGAFAYADATGVAAGFASPTGIAVDSAGNAYVADQSSNTIRKVSPTGVTTTVAGSLTAGFVGGIGAAARFNNPFGVAIDGNGNLYVADILNHAVRKISPGGVVSTLAGNGAAGFVNGIGSSARLNLPSSVAVDSAGNVFVADLGNQLIRKITPLGLVTTYAGLVGVAGATDGDTNSATFNQPYGVAVDAAGNVLVADSVNNRIRSISRNGVVTTLGGDGTAGGVDGVGTAASFNQPFGVAVDAAGNVFVTEYAGHRIRKIKPDGAVSTLAGNGSAGFANGLGAASIFNAPAGIAVDTGGNLYVADQNNNRIRKLTP